MWTTQINIKLHCDGQKTWKRNFECEQVSSELKHKNYILRPPLVMCTSYICRDYKHSVESRLHASSKIPGHHLFFLRLASSGRPRLSRFQKKECYEEGNDTWFHYFFNLTYKEHSLPQERRFVRMRGKFLNKVNLVVAAHCNPAFLAVACLWHTGLTILHITLVLSLILASGSKTPLQQKISSDLRLLYRVSARNILPDKKNTA